MHHPMPNGDHPMRDELRRHQPRSEALRRLQQGVSDAHRRHCHLPEQDVRGAVHQERWRRLRQRVRVHRDRPQELRSLRA